MAGSVKADNLVMGLRRLSCVVLGALVLTLLPVAPALAYEWPKLLKPGSSGSKVKALQMRVAGWYPARDQTLFEIDGSYQGQTKLAVMRFQEHYGLKADGVAGPSTLAALEALQDPDGSTAHFDFSEFWQNRNSNCSKKANSYAGTFEGGRIPAKQVKRNVKRLMWRLEAVRAKAGDKPIAINSGFRSVAYNRCINGATYSQHLYGTAADLRIVEVDNRTGRNKARGSQVHGIGCYSTQSHNHLDLRMHNDSLGGAQFWWWPERDDFGRDLASDGLPCYGEMKRRGMVSASGASTSGDEREWTEAELDVWKSQGEASNLHGLD